MAVTEKQVLGAKIRAEQEAYVLKHRKPYKGGGWTVPERKQVYAHLSKIFGLPSYEISYYFTYTSTCTHPWKDGACPECPK